MSDHEMQFFSENENERDVSELNNWSLEQLSVHAEPLLAYSVAEEKADAQSVERVWGRLEEHVERNYAFYYQDRKVPPLLLQAAPDEIARQRSKRFFRAFPWRRLDMIAALLFLTLLMGSLLTIVYNVRPQAQTGAPGMMSSPPMEICKGAMTADQQVTIIEGPKGVEVLPTMVVFRQGGQLTWVNKTGNDQVVVNAKTKEPALKIVRSGKSESQPLEASTYAYYVQSAGGQPSKVIAFGVPKGAQVMVRVLSIVMIVSGSKGVGDNFQPSALKIPHGSDLVWLNTTPDKQVVANTVPKQSEPFTLSPNSCQLQRDVQAGNYNYALKGSSDARFSLYAG